MDMLKYMINTGGKKICIGNYLIKRSQTCSQTCYSSNGGNHTPLSWIRITMHYHSDTFIFHVRVQKWHKRLSFWGRCGDIHNDLSMTGHTTQRSLLSAVQLTEQHIAQAASSYCTQVNWQTFNHKMCRPNAGSRMTEQFGGFSCFCSSTPIGGNVIILMKTSYSGAPQSHSHVWRRSQKAEKVSMWTLRHQLFFSQATFCSFAQLEKTNLNPERVKNNERLGWNSFCHDWTEV